MKSDRLGHASPSRGGLSGQNDDSSVVSLKALVARADPSVAAAPSDTVDDSGLIDLKKLMASASPPSDALPPVLAPSEAGLFDVPENTPLPHVMQTDSLSESAAENPSRRRGTWIAAGMLVMVAAIGIGAVGGLYVRKSRTAQLQSGVAAAVPVMTSEPSKFVEAPRPIETAPVVADVAPAPTETKAVDKTPRRSRQTAGNAARRERARQDPKPVTTKAEEKAPVIAPAPSPCDLKCEIERAARRSSKKKP